MEGPTSRKTKEPPKAPTTSGNWRCTNKLVKLPEILNEYIYLLIKQNPSLGLAVSPQRFIYNQGYTPDYVTNYM
jgi:hypothetical protein